MRRHPNEPSLEVLYILRSILLEEETFSAEMKKKIYSLNVQIKRLGGE